MLIIIVIIIAYIADTYTKFALHQAQGLEHLVTGNPTASQQGAEPCSLGTAHENVDMKHRLRSPGAKRAFTVSLVSLLSLCSSAEVIVKMKLFAFQINKYFQMAMPSPEGTMYRIRQQHELLPEGKFVHFHSLRK